MRYAIGIDMGGTTTKIGLFKEDGELTGSREIPTRVALGKDVMFDDIAQSALQLTKDAGISLSDCSAVIGVAGPVDNNGYVDVVVNLKMKHLYPAEELAKRLGGIRTAVSNDANVAALGEMWKGGGQGFENLVMVALGTGVGGGVVIDGKVINGAHGMAGEIGHIFTDPEETEHCNCGGCGCMEQKASATGIVRNTKRFLKQDAQDSVLKDTDPLTAKDIFDAAKGGDELAAYAVEYCIDHLARVISAVSYIVDPEVIVIGGGVSKAGEYLLEMIRRHYAKYLRLKDTYPEFRLALLGGEAGMYGAAKLAFDLA